MYLPEDTFPVIFNKTYGKTSFTKHYSFPFVIFPRNYVCRTISVQSKWDVPLQTSVKCNQTITHDEFFKEIFGYLGTLDRHILPKYLVNCHTYFYNT